MNKIFLNVLHEEEKLEDVSMDVLKGGQGSGCGSENMCPHINCSPNCSPNYS